MQVNEGWQAGESLRYGRRWAVVNVSQCVLSMEIELDSFPGAIPRNHGLATAHCSRVL